MSIILSILKTICLTFLFFLIGCENHDPNPELSDPIYKEYMDKAEENKKEIEAIEKSVAENQLDLTTDNPTKVHRLGIIAELNRLKKEKNEIIQMKRYYTIKAKKRAKYVRLRTLENINLKRQGLTEENQSQLWDPDKEYEAYQVNLKLREAPRDWNHRVPKLYEEEEF